MRFPDLTALASTLANPTRRVESRVPERMVADYAPAVMAAKYRELGTACEAGQCRYAVVPGSKPRPASPALCDGWHGAVRDEDVGPVLRVRPCDRRRDYERRSKEQRASEKSGKNSVGTSWRDGGGT